ncbi:MAG: NADH-ubiquinone oxidoreductase-F iron-sulfur binding region domain-containing protein [Bacteroidales bacterium]
MINKDSIIDFLQAAALRLENADSPAKDRMIKKMRRDSLTRALIAVSCSSCSLINGAESSLKAIRHYLKERGIDADLEYTGSLGFFDAEPVVSVQLPGMARILFKNIKAEKVIDLLDNIFNHIVPRDDVLGQIRNSLHTSWQGVNFLDDHPFFRQQERRVLKNCGLISPESIEAYIAQGGYTTLVYAINRLTPNEVTDKIRESSLRGRSGSGYPSGLKWEKTINFPANQKYVICNAFESDPGAFMERFMAENDPHLIIEGLVIAAYAIGAGKAFIYISWKNELAIKRLNKAISQAKAIGLIGDNIFNSGYNLQIEIFSSPGAFVCGQETALLNSIEGKRAIPSERPPYPTEHGLFGDPTLINNIETLANVPGIIRYGPRWFKQAGTKNCAGTKVFSLSGNISNSCVAEVPMGTTFTYLIDEIAGGVTPSGSMKAFLLGGPTGHILPPEKAELPIDFDILKEEHMALGSGGLILMNTNTCMVDIARYFTGFLTEESCGKCISCREGTKNMLNILEGITRRPGKDDKNQTLERFKGVLSIEELASVIHNTASCGLGENAPNIVIDTLKYFRAEYEAHIFERKCSANACRNLRVFYIRVENCVGCAACVNKCPTEAIYGLPKHPHFIIENKCIGCGLCQEACMFNAIFEK